MEDSGSLDAFEPGRTVKQKAAAGDSRGLVRRWVLGPAGYCDGLALACALREEDDYSCCQGSEVRLSWGTRGLCLWGTPGVLLLFKDGSHLLRRLPAFLSSASWAQSVCLERAAPFPVVFPVNILEPSVPRLLWVWCINVQPGRGAQRGGEMEYCWNDKYLAGDFSFTESLPLSFFFFNFGKNI